MSFSTTTLETITALCKRRGFVYQSADIYGGLNGVYDFGHLGVLLKNNIKNAWLTSMNATNKDTLLFDGAILGHEEIWRASGHLESFNDPMVDCLKCKHRYRTDEIDLSKPCPHCGNTAWTAIRQFNMMFKTDLGAATDKSSCVYLRPETAQSIFSNFKNIITTNRVKIPFGVMQIGKAFRNEITPKQFLFRVREFEQMEMEWFCKPEQAPEDFHYWRQERLKFYTNSIGLQADHVRLRDHEVSELSHYSKGTSDVEYQFPFGWKELEGIANRGNFDLTQHSKFSGKDLNVFDEETKQSYTPHVIETSVGVDRLFLTTFFDAYYEDEVDNEKRVVLRFDPRIAPIKAAILPLTKKQIEPALTLYQELRKQGFQIQFDESGSIGKRYRRQDEIGTPVCITYDFETEEDQTVTIRNRDTTQQERISLSAIADYLTNLLTKRM
jgi:glycyl-tRNA synthetase